MSEHMVIESTQRIQQQQHLPQAVVKQTLVPQTVIPQATAQQVAVQQVAFLMNKVQSIEGSMRRQTGDIAQIRSKLLEKQSGVEDVESYKEQITREEFNKAINYVCSLVVKQSSDNQQALTNQVKELKQHFASINASTANTNTVNTSRATNSKANKVIGIFPSQGSVKLSLPLLSDVHLPFKFIKPVAAGIAGLVLFALVIMFLGTR